MSSVPQSACALPVSLYRITALEAHMQYCLKGNNKTPTEPFLVNNQGCFSQTEHCVDSVSLFTAERLDSL